MTIKIPKRILIYLLINLILCVALFLLNITYGETLGYSSNIINFNGVIFCTYSIFSFVIMFYIIKAVNEEEHAKNILEQYTAINNYALHLEKLYKGMRSFKHDYINILSTLYNYIEISDSEELKEYFYKKIMPFHHSINDSDITLDDLGKINCLEVKSIIAAKVLYASLQNLKIKLDIIKSVDNFFIDIIDLSRVIGIYLDNAIEAAQESSNQHLDIGIIRKESSILIIIGNSTKTNNILLEEIYEEGYSSKGSERGIGLYNARDILSKYKNVVSKTSHSDYYFTQSLEIFSTS